MPDRRVEARALDGTIPRAEIARRLGVAPSTITRWLNPGADDRARETSLAWKKRNPERTRALDRAHHERGRHPCANGCGRLASARHSTCGGCRRDRAEQRAQLIADRWNAGARVADIAAELGSTPASVWQDVVRLRKAGRADYRQPPG